MSKNFWNNYKKPIIALAPMDGYTDSAFRRICREMNPEIVMFTEFTSAEGFHFAEEKLKGRFMYYAQEQPIIAQIFGSDIESFISAAKKLEAMGFAGIDINMGCPAKKVVKSEHGVALRKNHDLAFRIMEAVVKSTALPVSVKTRLGWENADDLIVFGKGAENVGINLMTVHGRTYSDSYGCPANFEPIYELKRELKIPLIGNGGIISIEDGIRKLGYLDGFMIGRASWGDPWIFSGKTRVSYEEKISVIKRHAEYLIELKGEKYGMLDMRKHLLLYIRFFPYASFYRLSLARVETFKDMETLLDEMAEEYKRAQDVISLAAASVVKSPSPSHMGERG